MSDQLVAQAIGNSPVHFIPDGDKLAIFPVVIDEENPVDLSIVDLKSADLPEIGVVIAVGWDVNAEAIRQMANAEKKKLHDVVAALRNAKFIDSGDIVIVNKFSGMDVPGTQFVVLSRRDVLGKISGLPVRLKLEQDRWDEGAGVPAAGGVHGESAIVVP